MLSDKQAMYAAHDFGQDGHIPAWILRRQHQWYPSSNLDKYEIASLTAQAKFSGRYDLDLDVSQNDVEMKDIDIGRLDIQTGDVHKYTLYLC